jgi:fatty acid desaturase
LEYPTHDLPFAPSRGRADATEAAPTLSAPAAQDYADLKRLVTERGLLIAQPGYYWLKTAIAVITLGAAIVVALVAHHPAILMADAVFLAFASTQVALLAHDVGHRQGYRGRRTNMFARIVFGNLLLGVSHTWWNNKHNQHHATPNHIDKDPDVIFPFFAFAVEQIEKKSPIVRPILAIQAYVFVCVLPLQAILMKYHSLLHIRKGPAKKPALQVSFMLIHLALYGALLYSMDSWAISLGFFAVHNAVFGLYNSSVFASNHKGMATISESTRLDFLREQVLTSRNVTGRPLTDFWYGGLNYQIEHHLFPTMPRNNLSKCQAIVRQFCAEKGVSYHETGLWASYKEGFRHLNETTASLRGGPRLATEAS